MIYLLSLQGMDDQGVKDQISVFKNVETQKMLNNPIADPTGVNLEDQKLLDKIIQYVNEGKIKLLIPNSLINDDVYATLSDQKKSEIDVKAMAVLAGVRNIKDLFDAGYQTSFEIQSAVHMLKLNIEDIEKNGGDVFII